MSDLTSRRLPELLSPAGSPEALDAAIEGGADAVYLGTSAFNARMYAKNFGGDDLSSAVLRAHTYGVKVYLTLNTLVTDRELPLFLKTAKEAYDMGVDALIVADLGGAAAIHRTYPRIELHASTQMSGHNSAMAKLLYDIGFSRMVIARETSRADLEAAVRNAPIEMEMFAHGALCVSHSGQCLFSSLVGGRSGNRGECAQPCRLPYSVNGKQSYPLSLKDLSLAAHVPSLIASGVSSLKLEGRMKPPEYVYQTTRVWRRLLDEGRAATPEEMQILSGVFSRGGFTDGYYTSRIDGKMLGIRSEEDKSRSRESNGFSGLARKLPLRLFAVMQKDAPIALTLSDGTVDVTVEGDIPQVARTAPMQQEDLEKSLCKFGGTSYTVASFAAHMDEGLMLPVSRLNDLRRRAMAAYIEKKIPSRPALEERALLPLSPRGKRKPLCSARFADPRQITPGAREFFDICYLPLHKHEEGIPGVVLPPVIAEHEMAAAEEMLRKAAKQGATHALVGNLGHIRMVKDAGLLPVGDFRLNVYNTQTVCILEQLGIDCLLLSPELTLPQLRDVRGNTGVITYGRIPLMTVEKCINREIADCRACTAGTAKLTDRRGVVFPVLREWEHRNVIYNSLPTCMSDKQDDLRRAGITHRHFIFSTESPEEVDAVIRAHQKGQPLQGNVRRLK